MHPFKNFRLCPQITTLLPPFFSFPWVRPGGSRRCGSGVDFAPAPESSFLVPWGARRLGYLLTSFSLISPASLASGSALITAAGMPLMLPGASLQGALSAWNGQSPGLVCWAPSRASLCGCFSLSGWGNPSGSRLFLSRSQPLLPQVWAP